MTKMNHSTILHQPWPRSIPLAIKVFLKQLEQRRSKSMWPSGSCTPPSSSRVEGVIGSLVFQVDMGKRTPSFCKCWSAWKDTLTSLQSKPSKNLIQILNAALGGAEKLERKMLRRQNGAVPLVAKRSGHNSVQKRRCGETRKAGASCKKACILRTQYNLGFTHSYLNQVPNLWKQSFW